MSTTRSSRSHANTDRSSSHLDARGASRPASAACPSAAASAAANAPDRTPEVGWIAGEGGLDGRGGRKRANNCCALAGRLTTTSDAPTAPRRLRCGRRLAAAAGLRRFGGGASSVGVGGGSSPREPARAEAPPQAEGGASSTATAEAASSAVGTGSACSRWRLLAPPELRDESPASSPAVVTDAVDATSPAWSASIGTASDQHAPPNAAACAALPLGPLLPPPPWPPASPTRSRSAELPRPPPTAAAGGAGGADACGEGYEKSGRPLFVGRRRGRLGGEGG